MAILYNKLNNIGLNFLKERFLSLDHALLTPAVSQKARRRGCCMDNTAKIKLWKENRMCPLGRVVICKEGRIPHCVIHPHLTRHGRRHPLVSLDTGTHVVALCRIASCTVQCRCLWLWKNFLLSTQRRTPFLCLYNIKNSEVICRALRSQTAGFKSWHSKSVNSRSFLIGA